MENEHVPTVRDKGVEILLLLPDFVVQKLMVYLVRELLERMAS